MGLQELLTTDDWHSGILVVEEILELLLDERVTDGASVLVGLKQDLDRVPHRSADLGYMTDRTRNTTVWDGPFKEAFIEMAQRTRNDRWPEDHSDERARDESKDGFWFIT